ncbi:hypothetical protein V8C44DRAFT_364900 [Trichoderma aethiopicum]
MADANNSGASPNDTLASSSMPFVILTGENSAAMYLLDLVRIQASPPLLEVHHGKSRYVLPVPKWSMNEGGKIPSWLMGAGSPPGPAGTAASTLEPDILLCPPGDSDGATCARRSIEHLHAALYFNPRSGGLMLENRSGNPIIYEHGGKDEQDVMLTKYTTQRTLLWKQKNYLIFGEYRFAVSFVTDDLGQAYKAYVDDQFNRNIGRLYNALAPSTLLNFIPSRFATLYRDIAAHKVFPNNRMMAGIDIRTGEPVVLKALYRDSLTLHDAFVRLSIMSDVNRGPREGLLKVLDYWCKCEPTDNILCPCERIDYSVPLAEHSFQDMPWHQVTADDRIRYFRQTLTGLASLHASGITHGHISPTSLLLLAEKRSEASASEEYLLKNLKAVLSVCMRPCKQRTQSLCIAPELLTGPLPQDSNDVSSASEAQETGDNQVVDAAPQYESNASVDAYLTPESLEVIDESLDNNLADQLIIVGANNTIDAIGQPIVRDADNMEQVLDEVPEALPRDPEIEERLQMTIRAMAADVWALAMSWLCVLVDLPDQKHITRDIHRQLLGDLEEKTNKGSINEQMMALVIRRMLQWEPQQRLSAGDALPAWDLMMIKGDKKRKRAEMA